ncbi:hypothetical protein K1719_024564 [Acacia pycnantha]|nr:hypothetical protein K1719_024564 [Acacia pycnantha]
MRNTNSESVAYRSFSPSNLKLEVSRKVTTGISGLWQPSVHSDVAFDPSMSALPIIVKREFTKCWIVHPPIGNVVGLGSRETGLVYPAMTVSQ